MKFKKYLKETSINRLIKHSNNDKISIAIITAFRGELSKQENIKKNNEIEKEIKPLGYGYIKLEGHWIEEQDGKKVNVKEISYFIIGKENDDLKFFLRKWISKYNQEAALFKPIGTSKFKIIYKNGSEENIGELNSNRAGDMYSKLRKGKKTFVFENIIEEGTMTSAFFISPKGEIVYTPTRHIQTVIRYPKKFGLDKEFIEYVYNFYNERMGQEGKAREQILLSLFKKGWIRLRRYRNFWSINLSILSNKTKSYLQKWASMLLKGKLEYEENDPYIDVKISQDSGKIISSDIKKLAGEVKEDKEYDLEHSKIEEMKDLLLYDFVEDFIKASADKNLSGKHGNIKGTEGFRPQGDGSYTRSSVPISGSPVL